MGGAIELNGVVVYGYQVGDGDGLRVRVSADEAEQLGLVPGQQVRVVGAGQPAGRFLLAATDGEPPFVWLRFRPLAARATG